MGPVIVGPVYFTNQHVYQVLANGIGVVLEFGTNPVSEYAVPLCEVLVFCKWRKMGEKGGFSKQFVCSAEFASMKKAAAQSSVYFSTTLCPVGAGRWLVATASSQQLADQYVEEGATQLMQANSAIPSNVYKLLMNALQAAPGRACGITALAELPNIKSFGHGVACRGRLLGEPIASAHAGLLKLQLYTVPVPVPFFIRCS